jgi:hypothetical protein
MEGTANDSGDAATLGNYASKSSSPSQLKRSDSSLVDEKQKLHASTQHKVSPKLGLSQAS